MRCIVPAKDIIHIADGATPTMNTTTNDLQDQLNNNGYAMLTWMGTTWKFIPDVTIDRLKGANKGHDEAWRRARAVRINLVNAAKRAAVHQRSVSNR